MKSVLMGDVSLLAKMLEKAKQEDIAPIAIMRQLATTFRQIYEITSWMDKGEAAASLCWQVKAAFTF